MRGRIAILAVLLTASAAHGLEKSMLSLKLPSELEARQSQFFLQHRFHGKINEEPLESFFGMSGGANVGLGFRVGLLKNLEIVALHVFNENEYSLAVGYAVKFPSLPLRAQVDAGIYTNKKFYVLSGGVEFKRKQFAAFRLDLASKAILNHLTPVVNVGYDTELEQAGLGIGLDAAISKKYSLIGEYYPRLNGDENGNGPKYDSFAVGLKVQTYGHHFLFHVGNNTEIGTRKLMAGSTAKDLFFGFGIQRLLEF